MAKASSPNKKGNLTIITGPMFAGKTEELLRQIRRAQYAQKEILIFKPSLDNRYSATEITSHLNNKITATIVSKSKEIYTYLKKQPKTEIIFLDELHFFDQKVVKVLNKLAKQGYQAIAAGLDQDFRGKPFENTSFLLALAEQVIKLAAICRICNEEANMTQRLINGQPALATDPVILVGGLEAYEARCRSCHLVGKLTASVGEKATSPCSVCQEGRGNKTNAREQAFTCNKCGELAKSGSIEAADPGKNNEQYREEWETYQEKTKEWLIKVYQEHQRKFAKQEVNKDNEATEKDKAIEETLAKEDEQLNKGNYYIIADHLRTTIFALADGAVFEPKGRGYILKKLVKRATLLGHFLKFPPENLLLFSQKLIEINGLFYTHLKENQNLILNNLKKEINRNFKFIQNSTQKITQYCQKSPQKLIPAEKIFFWYDTAGVPLELIEHHLSQKRYSFSQTEFNKLLAEQKKRGQEDRAKKEVAAF
ncbi:2044_t:CDS:2 [Entrophospora sp. SA101]|nr:2044_t:CDS:2 [Entrophospora sp. SA101]